VQTFPSSQSAPSGAVAHTSSTAPRAPSLSAGASDGAMHADAPKNAVTVENQAIRSR
jgi:hypothetical protein